MENQNHFTIINNYNFFNYKELQYKHNFIACKIYVDA